MPGKSQTQASLAILSEIDPAEVIERHANGDSISKMKQDYGVTTEAWYEWVKSHPGLMETLKLARQARANDLPWEALELAKEAQPDTVAVTREQIRTMLWIAERTGTEFTPKSEVKHEVNVIHQHLDALKNAQVIEAEIVDEEDAA